MIVSIRDDIECDWDSPQNINCLCLCFSGNETEAIRLLELGTDASIPDSRGQLPMLHAARYGERKKNAFFFFFEMFS